MKRNWILKVRARNNPKKGEHQSWFFFGTCCSRSIPRESASGRALNQPSMMESRHSKQLVKQANRSALYLMTKGPVLFTYFGLPDQFTIWAPRGKWFAEPYSTVWLLLHCAFFLQRDWFEWSSGILAENARENTRFEGWLCCLWSGRFRDTCQERRSQDKRIQDTSRSWYAWYHGACSPN